MELIKFVKIKKIINESYKTKTFVLDTEIGANPGQFVMVYLRDIDEKPFCLSKIGKNPEITVERKGSFTERFHALDVGDSVGIRGPFGNGFSGKENACFVAGGLGLAPLKPLINKIKIKTVIYGAKTEKDTIFKNKIKEFIVCTDDGSSGQRCFTTDLLENGLKKKKFRIVYACGPEIMLKRVFDICEENKIECEVSLERYMKCGFGICGQCACDDMLVCKDGPVFSSEQLIKLTEFGRFARLKSGKLVSLKEYFGQ